MESDHLVDGVDLGEGVEPPFVGAHRSRVVRRVRSRRHDNRWIRAFYHERGQQLVQVEI